MLFVDAFDGGRLSGVTVEIPGAGTTTTSGDGAFVLHATGTGPVPLLVSADGFHARETQVVMSSEPASVDILPTGRDFDLDFFEHVFRNLGEDHTEHWTLEPRFEIWTGVYERFEGDFYGDFVASEEVAPERFIDIAQDVIAADTTSTREQSRTLVLENRT